MRPDAVVMFSSPPAGGTYVKNAPEAGNFWFIVGSSEWQEPGFIETATVGAVSKHEDVVASVFGIFRWTGDDALERVALADGDEVLQLAQYVTI